MLLSPQLPVQDKINLSFGNSDPQISKALNRFSEYICIETQANSFEINDNLEGGTNLEIDHYSVHPTTS